MILYEKMLSVFGFIISKRPAAVKRAGVAIKYIKYIKELSTLIFRVVASFLISLCHRYPPYLPQIPPLFLIKSTVYSV